jgi:hypothetical protein
LEKEASALVQLVSAAVAADLHPTGANVLAHPADSADLPLVEDHPQEDLPLAAEVAAAAKIAATDFKFCTEILVFALLVKVRQFSSEFYLRSSTRHPRAGGNPGWPSSD